MKMLYKYPQAEFPYGWLVEENRRRGASGREFELIDTGVFDEDRYFDIFIEYAKASATISPFVLRSTTGARKTPTWVLPHLWFRNTWGWTIRPAPEPSSN